MDEDPAACHLVALDGIGDGDGRLADEPDITVHAAMIGEVELVLRLAGGIVLVVAVVGLHGNETSVTRLHALSREIDGDGQVAA